MIEAGAVEIEEEKMVEAVTLAQEPIRRIIEAQKDLYRKLDIKKREIAVKTVDPAKAGQIEQRISADLLRAIQVSRKKDERGRIRAPPQVAPRRRSRPKNEEEIRSNQADLLRPGEEAGPRISS